MNMLMRRITLAVLIAIALVAFGATARAQKQGTVQTRVVTFAGGTNHVVTFKAKDDLPENQNIVFWLDFAPDDNPTAPLGAEPLTVLTLATFQIKYTGTLVTGFSFNAEQMAAVPDGGSDITGYAVPAGSGTPPNLPGTTVPVKLIAKKVGVGRYTIGITFPSGSAGVTGDWTLEMDGLPVAPRIRALIAVDEVKAGFTALTDAGTGLCGPGTSCLAPCTATCTFPDFCHPSCKVPPYNICRYKPWLCEFRVIEWPKRFPPGCLSCPKPWEDPIPEDFTRVLVEFVPLDKQGEPLGPEKAADVKVNIQGGEPIGILVDQGDGQYTQAVQYRKGAPARVSVTAAGVTSPPIVPAPPGPPGPAPPPPPQKERPLLVAAVALAFVMWRRAQGVRTTKQE